MLKQNCLRSGGVMGIVGMSAIGALAFPLGLTAHRSLNTGQKPGSAKFKSSESALNRISDKNKGKILALNASLQKLFDSHKGEAEALLTKAGANIPALTKQASLDLEAMNKPLVTAPTLSSQSLSRLLPPRAGRNAADSMRELIARLDPSWHRGLASDLPKSEGGQFAYLPRGSFSRKDFRLGGSGQLPKDGPSNSAPMERTYNSPFEFGTGTLERYAVGDPSGHVVTYSHFNLGGVDYDWGRVYQTIHLPVGARGARITVDNLTGNHLLIGEAVLGYASGEVALNLKLLDGERLLAEDSRSLQRAILPVFGYIYEGRTVNTSRIVQFVRPDASTPMDVTAVIELESWAGGGGGSSMLAQASFDFRSIHVVYMS